ncbi:MAG TPA: SDR family oxidoreductase [Chryseosolibacter sp.]|nr:SDR family oxidoreductase [Chryseosolibacter sp.]
MTKLDQFSVEGKVAVITGGTGVLGSAMTLGLARAGAKTVVIGRRKEAGAEIENLVNAGGGSCVFIQADVLNGNELLSANDKILDRFGRIDILVNAAGGNLPGAVIPPDKTFFDLDMTEFGKVVELNLDGTVLPTKVFCHDMAKRKAGVIINIASMASFRPITRVVGYSAAKSAIKNFTEWLAVEMARKFGEGIRVNGIAPGYFLTEQNRSLLTNPDGSYTARGQSAISHTPFNRFGDPEELVGTLIWLCSDSSRFVTGVTIPVDGGFNAFCGV